VQRRTYKLAHVLSRSGKLLAWTLSAVPLVGVAELALHIKQTTSDVVTDAQWNAVRDDVKAEATTGDLILFAPFWTDPLGRLAFGDTLSGIKKEARADESRFARAFEVSIRGAHRRELAGWRKVSERKSGPFTIGVYENPKPEKVLADVLDGVGPERMTVTRVDAHGTETPCGWQRGVGQPGGLAVPQGPAVPGDRFICPGGGYVGAAVVDDDEHHPHLCLFATGTGTTRIRVNNVTFGEFLVGHAGVQWMTDRSPTAERIDLAFSAFDRPIGHHPHKVGSGWVSFEFSTAEFAGKRGDLVANVKGNSPASVRHFCFEASTR
jgi:hypothetical protein